MKKMFIPVTSSREGWGPRRIQLLGRFADATKGETISCVCGGSHLIGLDDLTLQTWIDAHGRHMPALPNEAPEVGNLLEEDDAGKTVSMLPALRYPDGRVEVVEQPIDEDPPPSSDDLDPAPMVKHTPDPYVIVNLPGVLLLKENELGAKTLRSALNGLLERLGDRKVSIAMTTLDPPSPAEAAKIDDDVTLLRSTFGADRNEPMEEAARRIVRAYINQNGRIPTTRNAIVEAAMIVCRPGPSWSVEEACTILRRDNGQERGFP